MATVTVTPYALGAGGYDSDGNVHRVSGTFSVAGNYTTGGDAFVVPGLGTVTQVMVNLSAPAASVVDASVGATGKLKLMTSAAEVANATSVAGLAGTFTAWGTP